MNGFRAWGLSAGLATLLGTAGILAAARESRLGPGSTRRSPTGNLARMEPLQVVVMGVSGCGKSSLGQALAHAMGAEFIEGDGHHPPENVARMAAGVPLTDADRAGWLATLADLLAQARQEGRPVVLACSALKRTYRDVLRRAGPLRFVLMTAPREVLAQRLVARSGHYMPASLLPSQLATLEPPQADEAAIVVDATHTLPVLVDTVLAQLHAPTHLTAAP